MYNPRQSAVLFNIQADEWNDYVELQIIPGTVQQSHRFKVDHEPIQNLKQQRELDPFIMQSFSKYINLNIERKSKIHNPVHEKLVSELKKHNFTLNVLDSQILIFINEAYLHSEKKNEKGEILITNYRIAFFVQDLDKKRKNIKLQIPLGYIQRISLKTEKKIVFILQIDLKYSLAWKFKFQTKQQAEKVQKFINLYAFSDRIKDNFALSHAKIDCTVKKINWLNNLESEYARIGFNTNQKYKKISNNYRICESYPSNIWVPSQATQMILKSVAKGRERQRIPVATYIYDVDNKSYGLWRGSQLKNVNERSNVDIQYLKQLSGSENKLIIIDCRSKSNAKLQNQQFYKFCEVQCLNLQNIHSIKENYSKLIKSCLGQNQNFIKMSIQSKWFQGVRDLIDSAFNIAKKFTQGNNIFIHCADGWDRTSQICALVLLIIDPYYRTMKGFSVLIQKQFSSFGQPFDLRIGSKGGSENQIPIFIQFLDCVSQMISQFPLSFQFTYKYLSNLSNLMYTNRFGNFLAGCQQQLLKEKIPEQTLSIWDQLYQNPLSSNPYYIQNDQPNKFLNLRISVKNIRFWHQNFFALTTPVRQTYNGLHPLAQQNQDYIYLECKKLEIGNNEIEKNIQNQKNLINFLTKQLQNHKNKVH